MAKNSGDNGENTRLRTRSDQHVVAGRRGPLSALTEDALERICDRIEAGESADGAARSEDITPDTLDTQRRAHPEIDHRVQRSLAVLEAKLLAEGSDGSRSSRSTLWQQWRLERLRPKAYHLPSRVETSGPDGAPAQMRVSISIDETRALARDGDDT
jgi:hypothetical protein